MKRFLIIKKNIYRRNYLFNVLCHFLQESYKLNFNLILYEIHKNQETNSNNNCT